jgi:hypothetical protein
MADDGVVSPYSLDSIDQMLRQKRAGGRYVSDADTRNAYAGALEAQASKNLQERQLNQQLSEWKQGFALQQKQYQDQRNAALFTGGMGLLSGGTKGYDWLKSNKFIGGSAVPGTSSGPTGGTANPALAYGTGDAWTATRTNAGPNYPYDIPSSTAGGPAVGYGGTAVDEGAPAAVAGVGTGGGAAVMPQMQVPAVSPFSSTSYAQFFPNMPNQPAGDAADAAALFNPVGGTTDTSWMDTFSAF